MQQATSSTVHSRTALVLAPITGALVSAAAGYALFALVFPGVYAEFFRAGSAIGVEREQPLLWAVALALLFQSVLITLPILFDGPLSTVGGGGMIGACVSRLAHREFHVIWHH